METKKNDGAENAAEGLLLPGTVLFFCLLALCMQGIPALAAIPEEVKRGSFAVLFFLLLAAAVFGAVTGKIPEREMVFLIVCLSMLLRCAYVILSGLYERQHDLGVYTGIGDEQVNPGHLGYIEFIYKFRKLPDMNPYELFSYYHPPLHYVISGLWLILLTGAGMAEEAAFESLQVLPLLYSGLFLLVCLQVLKLLGARGKGLYAGLFLCGLHPSLMYLAGSVNNDMLSTLLTACSIWLCLLWIRKKTLPLLLALALSIGLGLLCKINTAVIALPVALVFLMDLAGVLRGEGRVGRETWKTLRDYALFGITSGVVGLSWIARNLILFSVKPGISSATPESVMYTGAYGLWQRIGLPAAADWNFQFPFHGISAESCCNTWVILFQTALFAEEYPAGLAAFPMLLCRAAFVLSILAAIACALLFAAVWRKKTLLAVGEVKGKQPGALLRSRALLESCFLGTGYLAFLLSFVLFTVKYPYTCSSDFRYIVICLLYMGAGMAESAVLFPTGRFARIGGAVRTLTCAAAAAAACAVVVWQRWRRDMAFQVKKEKMKKEK